MSFELIRQVAAGSGPQREEAFSKLVLEYGPFVRNTCLRMLNNQAQAEDALQVVFLLLSQRVHAFDEKTVLSNWLYKTARYTCLNMQKNKHRRTKREMEAGLARWEANLDSAQKEKVYNQIAPHMDEALWTLPEKNREVLFLHFFMGKTQVEIARELGCSKQNVQKRIAKGLEKLRKKIEAQGVSVLPKSLGAVMGFVPGTAALELNTHQELMTCFKGKVAPVHIQSTLKGVKKMIFVEQCKTWGLRACGVLSAACLIGGTVAMAGGNPEAKKKKPTEVPMVKESQSEKSKGPWVLLAKGIIEGKEGYFQLSPNQGFRSVDTKISFKPEVQRSPDGKYEVVTTKINPTPNTIAWKTKIVNLVDKSEVELGEHVRNVSWSPVGDQLVFTKSNSGKRKQKGKSQPSKLYLAAADGSGAQMQPTKIKASGNVYAPQFSPDGKKLAFLASAPKRKSAKPVGKWGYYHLVVRDLEGSNQNTKVVTQFLKAFNWGVNSTKLVYNTPHAVVLHNLADGEKKEIDLLALSKKSPVYSKLGKWSPDGGQFWFQISNMKQLYRVTAEGELDAYDMTAEKNGKAVPFSIVDAKWIRAKSDM